MRLRVWVCFNCGNYYGSRSQEHLDLRGIETLQKPEVRQVGQARPKVTGHRSDCPDCGQQREPVQIEITRPDPSTVEYAPLT